MWNRNNFFLCSNIHAFKWTLAGDAENPFSRICIGPSFFLTRGDVFFRDLKLISFDLKILAPKFFFPPRFFLLCKSEKIRVPLLLIGFMRKKNFAAEKNFCIELNLKKKTFQSEIRTGAKKCDFIFWISLTLRKTGNVCSQCYKTVLENIVANVS
jgi:hypothetical protein